MDNYTKNTQTVSKPFIQPDSSDKISQKPMGIRQRIEEAYEKQKGNNEFTKEGEKILITIEIHEGEIRKIEEIIGNMGVTWFFPTKNPGLYIHPEIRVLKEKKLEFIQILKQGGILYSS